MREYCIIVLRKGQFSERTRWHIDYSTDIVPEVMLMTAVLGG